MVVRHDGSLVVVDVPLEGDDLSGPRWYCSNDHPADDDQSHAIYVANKRLSAFGRPPGGGSLDITLVPPR